jgi:hypothetical protein
MAEKYERALAPFGEMDAYPVRRDEPVPNGLLGTECHDRHTRDS